MKPILGTWIGEVLYLKIACQSGFVGVLPDLQWPHAQRVAAVTRKGTSMRILSISKKSWFWQYLDRFDLCPAQDYGRCENQCCQGLDIPHMSFVQLDSGKSYGFVDRMRRGKFASAKEDLKQRCLIHYIWAGKKSGFDRGTSQFGRLWAPQPMYWDNAGIMVLERSVYVMMVFAIKHRPIRHYLQAVEAGNPGRSTDTEWKDGRKMFLGLRKSGVS